MKTIALLDPLWFGHHPTYLKLFSEALLSLGLDVMVFCPEPQEIRKWINDSSSQDNGRIHCFELHEPEQSRVPARYFGQALHGLKLWRSAARAIERAHAETGVLPDLVFFPWLDSFVTHFQSRSLIDRIFPYDWSGLLFQPYHVRLALKFNALRHGPLDLNECLKSRRCRAVGVLDEGVAHKLEEKLRNKAVITFPDVTDEADPDRDFSVVKRIAEKSKGRKIISLLGSLEKRKGLLTLLEVAQLPASRDWFFVVAGELAEKSFAPHELEELQRLAADPPENCFFYFQFIADERKFNALVEKSDVLFAAYENFLHSSNILTKAAVFGKPVIVSRGHCMAERVHAYGTGVIIDYGSASQCMAAIGRLCDDGAVTGSAAAPDYDGYKTAHSRDRLVLSMKTILDCYR